MIRLGMEAIRKDKNRVDNFIETLDNIIKYQPANSNGKYYACVRNLRDRIVEIKQKGGDNIQGEDFKEIAYIQVKLIGFNYRKEQVQKEQVQTKPQISKATEEQLLKEIIGLGKLPTVRFPFLARPGREKFRPEALANRIYNGETFEKIDKELKEFIENVKKDILGLPENEERHYSNIIEKAIKYYDQAIRFHFKILELAKLQFSKAEKEKLEETFKSVGVYFPAELNQITADYAVPDDKLIALCKELEKAHKKPLPYEDF